ncbi:MAG: hypothetical protein HGB19_13015 [Chlorobiales bacterium]|nr:hypothetical protein [Chlorobiales bacterium]
MTLTAEEIELLSNKSFYEQKIRATEKLKALMHEIRLEYRSFINPSELYCPPETDFERGQITKGENYEGYPYVILDFPKYFSKMEIFTFRTMFWYGHGLIFSVILAGERLPHYRARFTSNYDMLVQNGIVIGKRDMWDWREEACLKLTTANRTKTEKIQSTLPFMKLISQYPPSVLANTQDVLSLAKTFYQTIFTVISCQAERGL